MKPLTWNDFRLFIDVIGVVALFLGLFILSMRKADRHMREDFAWSAWMVFMCIVGFFAACVPFYFVVEFFA